MLSLSQLIQQQQQQQQQQQSQAATEELTTTVVDESSSSPPISIKVEDRGETVTDDDVKPPPPPTAGGTKRPRDDFNDDDNDDSLHAKRSRIDPPNDGHVEESSDDEVEILFDNDDDDGHINDDHMLHPSLQAHYRKFHDDYPQTIHALYQGNKNQTTTTATTPQQLKLLHQAWIPMAQPGVPDVTVRTDMDRQQPKSYWKRRERGGPKVTLVETPAQVRRRVLKQKRALERQHMVTRWKSRKYNYTQEIDVGGAIARRARRLLGDKIRKEWKQQQKEQDRLKRQQQEQQNTQETIQEQLRQQLLQDGNESIEEQQQLLDRLTQSQVEQEEGNNNNNNDNDNIQKEEIEDPELAIPYKDRTDYWGYGKSVPAKKDLEFDYYQDPPIMTQSAWAEYQDEMIMPLDDDNDDEESGLTVPWGAIAQAYPSANCQRYYFQPNEGGGGKGTNGRYLHWKHAESMAYRYLCGTTTTTTTTNSSSSSSSSENDIALENRMMRVLQSQTKSPTEQPISFYSWKRSLLTMACQRGIGLQTFFEHSWSDPVEVAKQLDLIMKPDSNECSLAGQSLHRIKVLMEKRRKRIIEQYRIGNVEWAPHDASADDGVDDADFVSEVKLKQEAKEEEPDDDDDENPTSRPKNKAQEQSLSDTKTKDQTQGKTNEAVVVDLHSQSQSSKQGIPTMQESTHDALLFPNCNYVHIAGTQPPSPQSPLDPVGVLLGPVDRFARFYHHDKVNHTSYQLCMSTLMRRVARLHHHRHHNSNQNNGERKDMKQVQKQLWNLSDDYLALHASKNYLRQAYLSKGKVLEVPLVEYSLGILHTCSFLANGCAESSLSSPTVQFLDAVKKEDDDSDDDDLYGRCHKNFLPELGMKHVAIKIKKFLEPLVHHNGIQRFPKIHVTYALASIGRMLPDSAADILSKSLDNDEYLTPLHIMKKMLEHLDDQLMLDDQRHSSHGEQEDVVRAAELEYLMHDASRIFLNCVKTDSLNVDYHLWHIASLAGCLLLCSGNYIGSGARRYPSKKRNAMASPRLLKYLEHEVRAKMSKFFDTRMELARAIKLLLLLTEHQRGPRIHIAICSLLEWGQVISLLVGKDLDQQCDTIDSLHRFHKSEWINKHPPLQSKLLLAMRQGRTRFSFLANCLENEPGNIDRWRAMADALGVLGDSAGKGQKDEEHRKTCPACRFLRKPQIIDHDQIAEWNSKADWWGNDRCWWVDGLLRDKNLREYKKRHWATTGPVIQKLKELSPEMQPKGRSYGGSSNEAFDSTKLCAWLPAEDNCVREDDDPSSRERSKLFDARLPTAKPQQHVDDGTKDGKIDFPKLSGPHASVYEVICYKILILCHLKGPGHERVEVQVFPLVQASWDKKNRCVRHRCDEFLSLAWLYTMGLDIVAIAIAKK